MIPTVTTPQYGTIRNPKSTTCVCVSINQTFQTHTLVDISKPPGETEKLIFTYMAISINYTPFAPLFCCGSFVPPCLRTFLSFVVAVVLSSLISLISQLRASIVYLGPSTNTKTSPRYLYRFTARRPQSAHQGASYSPTPPARSNLQVVHACVRPTINRTEARGANIPTQEKNTTHAHKKDVEILFCCSMFWILR